MHQRVNNTSTLLGQNKRDDALVPKEPMRGLTSLDLRAPGSAVHHMSTLQEGIAHNPMSTSRSIDHPQQQRECFGFLGRTDHGPAIVSRSLIQESQARNLFNL